MLNRARYRALGVVALGVIGGCGGSEPPQQPQPSATLKVVSGSENKGLEPLIKNFARSAGIDVKMAYKGSVDISLELQKGAGGGYDAVWPANRIWIDLGDRQRVVKHVESVMRSPVVFGVRCSLLESLGWGETVTIADILAAVESGRVRMAMTSATQSNSGASFYLGALHAMSGATDALTAEQLADEALQDQLRRLLRSVDRSSGSSGWLKEALVARPERFDAMVNYEAMLIEANRELEAAGYGPLCAVYPADGLTIADSPLGYVDKGDGDKEAAFLELQEYLRSAQVQQRILALGRRTGLLGLQAEAADRSIWNPDWGIDLERTISPVPLPRGEVIREALVLYQTALRKPSWTVYVLDFSGSMEGEPAEELKLAMRTLLEPDIASRYLLQPAARDRHRVIAFNNGIVADWRAEGNDPAMLRELLANVQQLPTAGGTDMYPPITSALEMYAESASELEAFFPGIIVMSDGKSKGSVASVEDSLQRAGFERDVPVFAIAFGDADVGQLRALAEATSGRVFQAKGDLVGAFRKAKGYN